MASSKVMYSVPPRPVERNAASSTAGSRLVRFESRDTYRSMSASRERGVDRFGGMKVMNATCLPKLGLFSSSSSVAGSPGVVPD